MKSRVDALGSRIAPLFALRFNESVICGCCERCPKTSHKPTKAGQQGRLLSATVECVRACTCAFMFEYCVWVAVGFMHYGANLFRVTQSWQSNNKPAIPSWENEPWWIVYDQSIFLNDEIFNESCETCILMGPFAWWKANSSQRDKERWTTRVWFGSSLSQHTIQTVQPICIHAKDHSIHSSDLSGF